MKMFLWKRLPNLTDNWHPEGGLVVFAESKERSQEIVKVEVVKYDREQQKTVTSIVTPLVPWVDPDITIDVSGCDEDVIVFPDSGCC